MPAPERLRPLVAADVALRLGLAKPWDVMAALQARGAGGHASLDEFLADLSRIARLGPDELAQLQAETEQRLALGASDAAQALSRMGGPVASMVPHPRVAGTGVAGDDAVVGASAPLRRIADGRYRDFAPVGEGGMGIVYWALDTELNRQVAFKIVRPDIAVTGGDHTPTTPLHATPPRPDSPASRAFHELRARFLQEAWVTGGLEHPGVVPVYEMGQTAHGIPYYTMRFVRGNRTLSTALEEVSAFGPQGRLQLLEPFLKVCDTIGYAHSRGVIHRDLKPQNIALGEFGEVVVLDWGLAKMKGGADPAASRWQERIADYRASASLQTALGPLGTPGYMSPEAALGQLEEVAESSDIYSLGTILFEILTGRLPFTFTTYGEYVAQVSSQPAPAAIDVDPAVPQVLSDLCERALSQSPSRRPAQPAEVAAVIRQWQADTALASEIDQALQEARATLRAAGYVTGDERIQALDRVAGVCEQVLRRQADQAEARAMLGQAGSQRAEALAERDRAARRRLVRLAGVAALAAATLVAVGTAFAINAEKRQAERATHAAETASAEREEQRLRANREAGEARAARAQAESSARVAEAAESRAQAQAREASEARALAERKAQEAVAEAKRATEAGQALEQSYRRVRALALATAAHREAQTNPTVALHLAVAALEAEELPETMEVGLSALTLPVESGSLRTSASGFAAVKFLADDERVLTLSRDGTVELWDGQGRRVQEFQGARPPSLSTKREVAPSRLDAQGREIPAQFETIELAASLSLRELSAGSRVVTFGPAPTVVRVWTLTGEVTELVGHTHAITAAALDPEGKYVATADAAGEVLIWNALGRRIRRHPATGTRVVALALPREAAWVAALDLAGDVRILPRAAGAVAVTLGGSVTEPVEEDPGLRAARLHVLPGDRLLVPLATGLAAFTAQGTELWRVPKQAGSGQLLGGSSVQLIGVADDGRVSYQHAGDVVTVNVDGGEVGRFPFGENGEHSHNCLLTDGGTWLTASICGEADYHTYDAATGRSHLLLPTSLGVESAYALPSDDLSRVAVWEPGEREVHIFTRHPLTSWVRVSAAFAHIVFSRSGEVIVYEPVSGALSRWDVARGALSQPLTYVLAGAPRYASPDDQQGEPRLELQGERILFAAPMKTGVWEVRCIEAGRVTLERRAGAAWLSPSCDRLLVLPSEMATPSSRRALTAPEAPAAPQAACGAAGKACGADVPTPSPAGPDLPLQLLDTYGHVLARLPRASTVAFDDQGSRFLCGREDGTAALYDRDGRLLTSWKDVSRGHLASTGAHVLLERTGGSLALHSVAALTEVELPPRRLQSPADPLKPSSWKDTQLALPEPQFVFGGRAVAYRGAAGQVVVHDLLGRQICVLCEAPMAIDLAASTSSSLLLGVVRRAGTMSDGAERYLWRPDGSSLRLPSYEHNGADPGQATAAGDLIAVRGDRRSVILLDAAGHVRFSVPGIEPGFEWRLSPTGNGLVAGASPVRYQTEGAWYSAWAYWPLGRLDILQALRRRGARPLTREEESRYADLLDAPR